MVSEQVHETCSCGATFTYSGGYFIKSELSAFRDIHEACRARLSGATAPAEELRRMATYIENDMAETWGGSQPWLTNGNRVADLVAELLMDRANEIEEAGQ